MKPSQLSATLRNIADKIDNSKNPSKVLVARELKHIIAAFDIKDECPCGINREDCEYHKTTDKSVTTPVDESVEDFYSSWLPASGANSRGSELLWHVLRHMNKKNWDSSIDIDDVVKQIYGLGKAAGVSDSVLKYAENYARNNHSYAKQLGFPQ